jgi:hypothetical protein
MLIILATRWTRQSQSERELLKNSTICEVSMASRIPIYIARPNQEERKKSYNNLGKKASTSTNPSHNPTLHLSRAHQTSILVINTALERRLCPLLCPLLCLFIRDLFLLRWRTRTNARAHASSSGRCEDGRGNDGVGCCRCDLHLTDSGDEGIDGWSWDHGCYGYGSRDDDWLGKKCGSSVGFGLCMHVSGCPNRSSLTHASRCLHRW